MSLSVAIIGASGYTGAELIRLLSGHPRVDITGLYARRHAGANIAEVFPHLRGCLSMTVEEAEPERIAAVADVAFCALPHGQSAQMVAALRELGLRVVDLSADFRLRDPAVYAHWYGSESMPVHPVPGLLAEAAYGLPERYRSQIAGAELVACPGCYPTSTILAVAPLLERGLISPEGIIVDAKSGASGAGRSPSPSTHLPEAGEGVRAYKVAGVHRHTGEIEQELSAAAGSPVRLIFTPHLLPISRGILACIYAAPTDPDRDAGVYQAALEEAYRDEPFVTVLPRAQLPDTAHVRASNHAHIAVAYEPRVQRVLVISAIDNLVKGASGQAVQCMNIMQGWDETTGLTGMPVFP